MVLGLLWYAIRQRAALDKYGLRATGEIVELKIRGFDLLHHYPVIRFQTRTGQWITAASSDKVGIDEYSKGQKIEVIYLLTNPQQFRIVSELENLFRPTPPHVPARLAKGQERRYGPKPRPRDDQ